MTKIISIGTATPQYFEQQEGILEFMHQAYNNPQASRKLNVLFRYSGIAKRYSAVPDFSRSRLKPVLFNGESTRPQVESRLDVFRANALPLALEAVDNSFRNLNTDVKAFGITHVISVTCTGLYAPGLDAELLEKLELPNDTYHTAVNFLGCNAAFHAMKIADFICRSEPDARVLVVCVELCSLHFQPKDNDDNLLSNTIFGDGAAAMVMTGDDFQNHEGQSFTIEGFHSLVLNKGKNLMGWNITPVNFEMILNTRIPEFIGSELHDILFRMSEKIDVDTSRIDNYAVHPGGRKILDTVKRKLELQDDKLAISYNVLNEFGNMSSPTILFILQAFLKQEGKQNENLFAIGFGPGLSIESAMLRYD